MDALTVPRLHFAFTVTFHYLFPQLTMGLALLILILKTMVLRTGDEHYSRAARFWGKIFAINFAMGAVTGIAMEFQFGTNWARFSKAAGGVLRADARHGRSILLLSRIQLPGRSPVRRKTARAEGALVHRFPGLRRLMIFRFLH